MKPIPPYNVLPILFAAITSLVGCADTAYVELGKEPAPALNQGRTVAVEIDRSYLHDFPECTVILKPSAPPQLKEFEPIVEAALSRHFPRKLSRVIDPAERRRIARRHASDLRLRGDQIELAANAHCETLLNTRIVGPGSTYLLVWSQVQIGIEITITRAQDDRILWRARHVADRSEGGIPLSPIGVVFDAYTSTRFSTDRDITESVVDDAIRRIVKALPDARQIGTHP
jgi:hypothetical protein